MQDLIGLNNKLFMANPPNVVVILPKSDKAIPNPPLTPTNIAVIIPKSVLTC